jgi:UDP-glucuronate 4-epimerase
MKILITGAAGHIGANLAKVISKNHEVVGIDNFSNYYDVSYKKHRIKSLKIDKVIKNVDIRDIKKLRKTINNFKPEVVVHLAGRPGVRASSQQIPEYTENNIDGFLNIANSAKEFGVNRLIYASSSSVYTELNKKPFCESDQLNYPKSFYAISKQVNEMTAQYLASKDFQIIGLRLFTVYGPWGRPDMAILQFIGNSLLNKKSSLTTDLDTLRDFTFIDDVVKVIENCFSVRIEEDHEIFNVGGSVPRSIRELIEVLNKNGIFPEFDIKPTAAEDIKFTNASIAKLKSFGLHIPNISLEIGIEKTVLWMNQSDRKITLKSINKFSQ